MNRRLERQVLVLAVLLGALAVSAPAAEAGLLDSLKGMFTKASDTVKGWFSGGSEKEFTAMLDQVEQSQATVAERQNKILDQVSGSGAASVSPKDPNYQASLNELSTAATANEQLFQKLLTVRQELVDKKKDTSKYDERMTRVQKSQHDLEEGWQALQKFNKDVGAFTPPAQVAAAAAGNLFDDPRAQGFIDEWLAGVDLDQWGRIIVEPVITASGDPDHGSKSRHQFVWEMLGDDTAGSNLTLRDYVEHRMAGEAPNLVRPQRDIITEPTGAVLASTGGSSPTPASGTSAAGSLEGPGAAGTTSLTDGTLNQLDAALKQAMDAYQKMAADGQGQSLQAQKLLASITSLKAKRDQAVSQGVAASGGSN